MRDATVDSHRWSRAEYDRAAAAGVFSADARLELIDGEILDMTPQGSRHATAFSLVADAVQRAFGPGYYVRLQLPLALADDSEPEPDVAVVEGGVRDYRDEHPRTALLIVEVSDDSLRRDRTVKQRLYARCSVPDYWILSLADAHLEIYRDPGDDGYRTVIVRRAGETVTPLSRPEATIRVSDLLP
jgi:Uma2 family endonuclease